MTRKDGLIIDPDGMAIENFGLPVIVIETAGACLLFEPKRADQMELDEVQARARAAVRWCA